jgi:hypothetical protein
MVPVEAHVKGEAGVFGKRELKTVAERSPQLKLRQARHERLSMQARCLQVASVFGSRFEPVARVFSMIGRNKVEIPTHAFILPYLGEG